jgi:hypothetical protein
MWVMAPDAAFKVDDRDGWVFHVADAQQQPFHWKGIDYTAGLVAGTPGYLDCEIPPGTYVVWAERADKPTVLTTHRAVVAVHDEPVVTVRLLPLVPADPGGGGDQHPCSLEILGVDAVMAAGSEVPRKVEVTGTATGCAKVHVVVSRMAGPGSSEGDVTVKADGTWRYAFANDLKVRCGEEVLVEVTCLKDRSCRGRATLPVRCHQPDRTRG